MRDMLNTNFDLLSKPVDPIFKEQYKPTKMTGIKYHYFILFNVYFLKTSFKQLFTAF